MLCEASPVLVAYCSSSDKQLVQKELAGVTSQWADIEKTWNKRDAEMGDVKETATQYHNIHDPLLAKLTDLEQRLTEQPPVGTELDIVKEQLQEQKVTVVLLANKRHLVDRQNNLKPRDKVVWFMELKRGFGCWICSRVSSVQRLPLFVNRKLLSLPSVGTR